MNVRPMFAQAQTWTGVLLLVALAGLSTGCSVRKFAVNQVGNALAGGGTTFASDDDPELIKAAVPFSLKLMESLLAESPRHKGLLFATASSFTQYAYAFVQQEADELEERDVTAALELRARARRLYLRARDYGLRGLEVNHRGFAQTLRANPKVAVTQARRRDVPLLYWTAVSWAAAISVTKDNADLIADLPQVEALIDRALALDPDYDCGAIHSFLITYEMSRSASPGDPEVLSRQHFALTLALTQGQAAAPYLALAESVAQPRQDKREFTDLVDRALAIDPNARPEWRLVNLVMQRRARWLRARLDQLFVD